MSMPVAIVLRDIHEPAAPSWWPPAPGWWLLVAVVLAIVAAVLWWRRRRRRRRARIQALFDDALATATSPAAEVAAMSELLRRAARRRDPGADRLQGVAWRAFLDQGETPLFADEVGELLIEGGYRREVDAGQVAKLRPLARARFLQWMGAR
ncbi:DUF4381 domain-containing protein [Marilutibacter maris]|uniref:DUF4381 domain-containing protein n=1 Tax=Marilutibacter maris TaxID=1605891 RepID=A0A2U9T6H0_9GAMM|nr:DUF4381 domain-containing protein [Lysobacter maris]AWV08366.1 hypothetical protein C9I47_2690 [Lysobacter maris]